MTKLTCYGGVGTVTGANFLLEAGSHKYLVDCGLLQGVEGADEVNRQKFEYDPGEIKALFVTHAHIDHIGRIPKLVKEGFSGAIYSTGATRRIAELMLADAVKIMDRNAREEGGEPMYGMGDMERSLSLWQEIEYHETKDFGELSLKAYDAGHILGSAMYELTFPGGKKLFFAGDLGNSPSILLKDTEKVRGMSYMVIDSVYGDRRHEDKEEREEMFRQVVEDAVGKSGTLLIPVFSLERTQMVLYMLDNLVESGKLPKVPVFLDSPLAIRVTDVYERLSEHYKSEVQAELRRGDKIFDFPRLRETAQVRDSREIAKTGGPKIILAGSGMSTAGRIVGHEEMYLPDPKNTILFIGYQAPGTLGRDISEGHKRVVINDHPVEVRARVEQIDGFSGHADTDALLDFVSESAETLSQVFVAMGEPQSSIFLAQRIRDELGVKAVVPERKKTYDLEL